MASSIVAIEPTRQMLAEYRFDQSVSKGAAAYGNHTFFHHNRTISLQMRDAARWGQVWATNRKGWATVLIPSGGLKLTATLPPPPWTSRESSRMARLKPYWTEHQYERALDRLVRWAMAEIQRIEYVEVVWRAEQRIEKTPAFTEAILAEEQRLGRDSAYDTMTIEDAEHWDKWLGAWMHKVRHELA